MTASIKVLIASSHALMTAFDALVGIERYLYQSFVECRRLENWFMSWPHHTCAESSSARVRILSTVLGPKVLLLDEPLGALDNELRMQLEFRALQRSINITFVFITHDQEEALPMSDRVAVMSEGRYLQIDSPILLYEAPQYRAIADFIGTMNIFEAQVKGLVDLTALIDVGLLGTFATKVGKQLFVVDSPGAPPRLTTARSTSRKGQTRTIPTPPRKVRKVSESRPAGPDVWFKGTSRRRAG